MKEYSPAEVGSCNSNVMSSPEGVTRTGRVGFVEIRRKGEGAERLTFLPAKYPEMRREPV
jgi:hypothetical protein